MSVADSELERRILVVRGKRVMLDADLAAVYGLATKRLNEQVRRNAQRFPPDFMFQLKREEVEALRGSRSQFATLKRGGNFKSPTTRTCAGSPRY